MEKKIYILLPQGFETRTTKSVWGQYDYSIPAHENIVKSSTEDEKSLVSSVNYL